VSDRTGTGVVMIEAFNIMQDRLTRMRLAGDPPDVHITPHIGHISWLDFHCAEEAIAAGKAATETALEPIEATIAALA
jgi:NTE family protein